MTLDYLSQEGRRLANFAEKHLGEDYAAGVDRVWWWIARDDFDQWCTVDQINELYFECLEGRVEKYHASLYEERGASRDSTRYLQGMIQTIEHYAWEFIE